MLERWESYRTRRLPVNPATGRDPDQVMADPTSNVQIDPTNLVSVQRKALYLRRELMRRELPERYQDVLFNGGQGLPGPPPWIPSSFPYAAYVEPVFLEVPDLTNAALTVPTSSATHFAYLRRIFALFGRPGPYADPRYDYSTPAKTFETLALKHQSAECLYMILTTGTNDESFGRNQVRPSETGDVDQDGMPEFLDAWGRPIEWFRWPAGFLSDLQPGVMMGGLPQRDVSNSGDPFDPQQVGLAVPPPQDPMQPGDDASIPAPWAYNFRLTPLIVSAGQDGEFGLFFGHHFLDDYASLGSAEKLTLTKDANPYALHAQSAGVYWQRAFPVPGEDTGNTAHLDNIHSHELGVRTP